MPTEPNQLQRTILQGVWPWFGLLEGGKGVVLRTSAQSLHSALAPQIPRSLDANTPDEVTAFEKSLLHWDNLRPQTGPQLGGTERRKDVLVSFHNVLAILYILECQRHLSFFISPSLPIEPKEIIGHPGIFWMLVVGLGMCRVYKMRRVFEALVFLSVRWGRE